MVRSRLRSATALVSVLALFSNAALADVGASGAWGDRATGPTARTRVLRWAALSVPPAVESLIDRRTSFASAGVASADEALAVPADDASLLSLASDALNRSALAASLSQLGTIGRVIRPARATGRTVMLVQDVHRNAEAQANIGQAIAAAATAGAIRLVALEGATADIDVSRFQSFSDRAAIQGAADFALSQFHISGPVHAALTAFRDVPLTGIDDPSAYNANKEAYIASRAHIAAARVALAGLEGSASSARATVVSPALASFDAEVAAYRRGARPLGAHLSALIRAAGRTPPEVARFRDALALEAALDFTAVESQRKALLEALAGHLDRGALAALGAQTLKLRLGRLSDSAFYSALASLCERNGLPLSRYPAMAAYVRYVSLSESLNVDALLKETDALEDEAYEHFVVTPAERRWVAATRALRRVSRLLDLSLSSDEWRRYERDPSLTQTLSAAGLDPRDLAREIAPFESFYRNAEIRDGVMAEHLLARMNRDHITAAALVAGGFHTAGLAQRLSDAGVAVVTWAPRITNAPGDANAYLGAFTREKTPLEKIFEGDRLFLAESPLFSRALLAASAAALADRRGTGRFDRSMAALYPPLSTGTRVLYRSSRATLVWMKGAFVRIGFTLQGRLSAIALVGGTSVVTVLVLQGPALVAAATRSAALIDATAPPGALPALFTGAALAGCALATAGRRRGAVSALGAEKRGAPRGGAPLLRSLTAALLITTAGWLPNNLLPSARAQAPNRRPAAAARAESAPAVHAVRGAVREAQPIEIEGVGFGKKETLSENADAARPAAPLIWDPVADARATSAWGVRRSWNEIQNFTVAREGPNGRPVWKGVPGVGTYALGFNRPLRDREILYAAFWIKRNFVLNRRTNWKEFRSWSHVGAQPNFYDAENNGRVFRENDEASGYWYQPMHEQTDDRGRPKATLLNWTYHEVQLAASSVDKKDGAFLVRRDGRRMHGKPVRTRDSREAAFLTEHFPVHEVRAGFPGWKDTNTVWVYSIYVDVNPNADGTASDVPHVLLGDRPTYAASRRFAAQIPIRWSDERVAVHGNTDGFTAGQTAYLYVVNEHGGVNERGFAVTIGGGTPLSAPMAPARRPAASVPLQAEPKRSEAATSAPTESAKPRSDRPAEPVKAPAAPKAGRPAADRAAAPPASVNGIVMSAPVLFVGSAALVALGIVIGILIEKGRSPGRRNRSLRLLIPFALALAASAPASAAPAIGALSSSFEQPIPSTTAPISREEAKAEARLADAIAGVARRSALGERLDVANLADALEGVGLRRDLAGLNDDLVALRGSGATIAGLTTDGRARIARRVADRLRDDLRAGRLSGAALTEAILQVDAVGLSLPAADVVGGTSIATIVVPWADAAEMTRAVADCVRLGRRMTAGHILVLALDTDQDGARFKTALANAWKDAGLDGAIGLVLAPAAGGRLINRNGIDEAPLAEALRSQATARALLETGQLAFLYPKGVAPDRGALDPSSVLARMPLLFWSDFLNAYLPLAPAMLRDVLAIADAARAFA